MSPSSLVTGYTGASLLLTGTSDTGTGAGVEVDQATITTFEEFEVIGNNGDHAVSLRNCDVIVSDAIVITGNNGKNCIFLQTATLEATASITLTGEVSVTLVLLGGML